MKQDGTHSKNDFYELKFDLDRNNYEDIVLVLQLQVAMCCNSTDHFIGKKEAFESELHYRCDNLYEI